VGTWLDVAGALVGRGQGVPPAIEIDGGRLTLTDAPQLGGGAQSSATGTVPLTVRLNRRGHRARSRADRCHRQFRRGAGSGGRIRGARERGGADCGPDRRGRFGPDVQILSSDGGAVLRAAGVFRTAHGGRMRSTCNRWKPRKAMRDGCASRARACATRPPWRSF
jgi:hypothetical protein